MNILQHAFACGNAIAYRDVSSSAAYHGRLEVLRWLLANNTLKSDCLAAAEGGQLETLKWMQVTKTFFFLIRNNNNYYNNYYYNSSKPQHWRVAYKW